MTSAIAAPKLFEPNTVVNLIRSLKTSSLATQRLINGFADGLIDQSGIDLANCVNATYDAANQRYSSVQSGKAYNGNGAVVAQTNAGNGSNAVRNNRTILPGSEISGGGGSFTISFGNSNLGSAVFTAVYIAEKASSGNPWAYVPGTRIQLFFNGGNAGFTLGLNATITSDVNNNPITPTKDYVIIFVRPNYFYITNTPAKTTMPNYGSYAADNSATPDPAGLTADSFCYAFLEMTISGNADMTLTTSNKSSVITPANYQGIMLWNTLDGAVLGTDIKMYSSRGGFVNQTEIPMKDMGVYGSVSGQSYRIIVGEGGFGSQPAPASNARITVKTFNGKNQLITGLGALWA